MYTLENILKAAKELQVAAEKGKSITEASMEDYGENPPPHAYIMEALGNLQTYLVRIQCNQYICTAALIEHLAAKDSTEEGDS